MCQTPSNDLLCSKVHCGTTLVNARPSPDGPSGSGYTAFFSAPSIPQPPWPLSPSPSLSRTHAHTHTHTQFPGWVESGLRQCFALCSNAGCRALAKWDYHRSYAVSGLEVHRGVSWEGEDAIIRLLDYIMEGRRFISNTSADAQAAGGGGLCARPRCFLRAILWFFLKK